MTQPTITVETITPEIASDVLLNHNGHNRRLAPHRVQQFTAAMTRGEWEFNGEAIKFNCDGTLLDGQHRLAAICQSGIAQQVLVIRGLTSVAQETMDRGKPRSFSDMLSLRGYKNPTVLGGAANWLQAFLNNPPHPRRRDINTTNQSLYTIVEQHPLLEHYAGLRRCPLLEPSFKAASHYLFSIVDADDADEFFDVLTGGGSEPGHPIHTLHHGLLKMRLSPRKARPEFVAAVTHKAWNKWRRGEEWHKLTWVPGGTKNEPFPDWRVTADWYIANEPMPIPRADPS